MVTSLEPRTQTGQGTGHRSCDGCPRCARPDSPTCNIPHPKFANRHPVCKVCGHCVLRGQHQDDASDLDDQPGIQRRRRRVRRETQPQLNRMMLNRRSRSS